MPEFSNLLRQRLAAGERAGVHPSGHPDADTLTAYAEQLLTAPERSQVLRHLCACDECREVVALSLPEVEAVNPVAVVPAPAAGSRLFAWKWRSSFGLAAASAAALAIVTVVVIEAPHKPPTPSMDRASQTAPISPSASAPATSADNTPATAQPEAKAVSPGAVSDFSTNVASMQARASHEPGRERERLQRFAAVAPPPPSPAVSEPSGAMFATRMDRQDYKNETMFEEARRVEPRTAALNDLPVAPAPQPSNQNLFAISSTAPTSSSFLNQNAPTGPPLRIANPASGNRRLGMVGSEIKDFIFSPKKYTPAISGKSFMGNNAMGGPQLNPAKEKDQSVEVTGASPTLDRDKAAAGSLSQTSAFTPGALRGESYSADAREKKESAPTWKVADAKLWKLSDSTTWVEGYSGGEAIAFFVVSPRGLDVWAGGAGAALVHSRDGGATWERVTLGASATGTITGIENGHSSVRVKSSSGQSWSSADGGKSWNVQD